MDIILFIDDLKAKHQLCTFHIMQNLMKDVIKIQNRLKSQIRAKQKAIKEKTNKISAYKNKNIKKESIKKIKALKKETRKLKHRQKEWEQITERISNIFKANTHNKTKIRFNKLFNSIKYLPDIIGKFPHKLKPKLEKTINHTTKNNIPSTNNKLERQYGITLPGYLKKRYRTDTGLKIHLDLNQKRWIQRNKKTAKF